MFTQLIQSDYLFTRSIVDDNVDPKLLDQAIIEAQDLNIQSILGENLYQSIMLQASTNTFTNQMYEILLKNFIQPSLLQWSIYHGLPYINFKITNKSLVNQTSDHSQNSGLDGVKYMREIIRDKAEFYNQRIREQIVNNPASYPEYFTQIGIERILPKRTTYFSGFAGRRKYPPINPGYGDPDCCDGGSYKLY